MIWLFKNKSEGAWENYAPFIYPCKYFKHGCFMSFRIIHIEDSEIQRILTQKVLEKTFGDKEDYYYTWTETLEKALNLLDEGCLDVILIDLGLPDTLTTNPIAPIKKKCPQTPIIVLTANDDVETAKECVRSGADAYLLKGNLSSLPLIVIMAVERWELRQEQKRISDMYKSIVEESPDWIVRFTPNGTITFANNSALIGMNENAESILGKQIDNYLDPNQKTGHEETISRISLEEPHVEGKDMWLNGHLIQWRKSGIFNSRGKLIEIQSIGKDVTDQHFMMQRLIKDVAKMTEDNVVNANRITDNAIETMKRTLKQLDTGVNDG